MSDGQTAFFHIWEGFQAGDTLVHCRNVTRGATVDIVAHHAIRGYTTIGPIGICAEPIFVESVPASSRRLAILGPEIRLYDVGEKRYGPVVGFVSSYKGGRVPSIKRRGPFRLWIDRVFDRDRFVMAVFMLVLLGLGIAIGVAIGAALFLS